MRKFLAALLASIVLLVLTQGTSYAAVKYSPQTVSVLNYNQTNLKVTFANVKKASNISYDLVYEANGIAQGVGGSIQPKGKTIVAKTITIGTCSSGTCVNHKKLKKMKLMVTFSFPGKTISKTYTIKTK